MNGNSSGKLLKNLQCMTCNSQFFFKEFTLKGSKCPLLLHCGHSVCESCIQQNIKSMKSIKCQLCGFVSSSESPECFPLNVYLMGSLLALQSSKYEKDKRLACLTKSDGNFNYTIKVQSNINSKTDSSLGVCEECSFTAPWYCENCKSTFCELCWTRVHGSAKSLMKHCKTAICKFESMKNSLRKCPEHETQDLEFFCQGCSTVVCSYCVILRHQGEGHNPITLKEKNVEMVNKVNIAAEEAKKIRKRMRHTVEKLKSVQSSFDVPDNRLFSKLESQIAINFARLHGILQLEEERLLKKLREKRNERENCMTTLRMQLEKQLKQVECLLNEWEFVVKKPQSSDLTDLHRQLKEVQTYPCYLISPKPDKEEVKIAFDEGLIEMLRIYCTMDLPSSEIFELRSSSDLPEDYDVECLNDSDVEGNLKGQESSISDTETWSNCSSRDIAKRNSDVSLSKVPNQPKVFHENKNYSVRVCYIKNPGEFYVTLNSQRSKQQAIDKMASQFANCSDIPETFAKGEIYLVKYKVDQKWYRARIIEVISTKKTGDEECVLVYYLDYGNSETVPISRLRPIPRDMLEEPPLAIKCKLFDCFPKNEEWCVESTKIMEKILGDYTATMFVMKVHQDCLEVDLSVVYPEGQIGREIVSVRDALLFLEFSCFVHGSKIPRNANVQKYLPQCLPQVGESYDVILTHVNSPSDFYVHKTRQDTPYLYKLSVDMQNFYMENLDKGIIYNPTVGKPCAALFSADKMWYRARIIDIPGKKMVTVFYVDYGNTEILPWTAIRKLKENFVRRPPLALNCSLAGILPADALWSTQTKSYLEKCVLIRNCRILIYGKPKAKQKLRVFLYKKEVCVNTFFVDMGYAVASRSDCLWMLKIREKGEEEKEPQSERKTNEEKSNNETGEEDQRASDVEDDLLKINHAFESNKDQRKSQLDAEGLRNLHESREKNSDEEAPSVEDDECKNVFKIRVQILRVVSPSSIYVTFTSLMEEFQSLQSKLNEFYQSSSPVAIKELTVGSVCAVFDSEKNCWYRAYVLEILPDDKIKVFRKDVAEVSTEPLSAIRELDPSFKKYAACAVKCHLANIRPPSDQWPSISCEYLLQELDNHKEIYMTKRGQIVNRSLPVDLWVQKVTTKGALEPSVKEWVILNRLLVNQGLAVPTKPKMWYNLIPTNDEEFSDFEKVYQSNHVTDATFLSNEKDVKEMSSKPSPSVSPLWIPPQPLKQSRFIGIPTYVDFNAFIYLHDIEEGEEKLQLIREVLLKEYGNSQSSPEDHFWSPGELCVARYHFDNSWYRGVILKTNEDYTYEVLFVDYGNTETCQAQDLKKNILMHDIPILAHKFQLQGIEPVSEDGKWPVSVIDTLHSLVVDKKCEVNILNPLDSGEIKCISLRIIEDNVDVSMLLIDQGLASLKYSMKDSSIDSDPEFICKENFSSELDEDSAVPSYIPLTIPEQCNGFFVQVTTVQSETEVYGNIVDDESLSFSLKKVLKEFKTLEQKMMEECHLQPLLDKLIKGRPCCCLHLGSSKWCRGEVEHFDKNKNSICVFYVDNGNKEFLNKNLVHQCKSDWMNHPKMAVQFRLANIEKCPNVSKSLYMKDLIGCLNEKLLFAEILNKREEVLEVRLLTERNGPLAYQEMVEKNLMRFK